MDALERLLAIGCGFYPETVGDQVHPGEFLDHAYRNFAEAAAKWLTGSEPFTARLNPAYAPYGDYDQLMRLEEWYGRT